MGLKSDVEEMRERLRKTEDLLEIRKERKRKGIKIKLPGFLSRAVNKDENISVCLWLGQSHNAEFKKAEFRDGLIYVGDQSFLYEESAIYRLKIGRKRVPFVVVFSWRLTPVGGKTDVDFVRLLEADKAAEFADEHKLHNAGQLTIVRRLEQEQTEEKKKRGGINLIWWIILAVVALYLLLQWMGVGV